ncbi:hypothetical protein D3C84_983900 [compost metagenome]
MAGHVVHQEAAVEAQQGANDQCAADHQADVGNVQSKAVRQVNDQVGQCDCPGQRQDE